MKIELDPYIVDTLMPDLVGHDHRPSAFLVFLFLWYQCQQNRSRRTRLSLNEIAEGTGLSKRSTQTAISKLIARKLIGKESESITETPTYCVYSPWKKRNR